MQTLVFVVFVIIEVCELSVLLKNTDVVEYFKVCQFSIQMTSNPPNARDKKQFQCEAVFNLSTS